MTNQVPAPSKQLSQQEINAIFQNLVTDAAQMMRNGQGRYQIIASLKTRGLPEQTAASIVDRLEQARASALKKRASHDMLIGGLICIVGIVVTVGSYAAASSSSSGGSYVVAWGAIIFGGIQFFRGLSHL